MVTKVTDSVVKQYTGAVEVPGYGTSVVSVRVAGVEGGQTFEARVERDSYSNLQPHAAFTLTRAQAKALYAALGAALLAGQ